VDKNQSRSKREERKEMAAIVAANDKDWRKDCVKPEKDTRVQTAVSVVAPLRASVVVPLPVGGEERRSHWGGEKIIP